MAEEIAVAAGAAKAETPQFEGNSSDESVTEDTPDLEESEPDSSEVGDPKKAVSAKTTAGEAVGAKPAKEVYTPEELENLLQTDGDVDSSRLSSEGRILMKSFQRGYDQKFQQLAKERKAASAPAPQTPREKLYERYMRDPGGVVAEINAEIENQEGVDPTDANYPGARRAIARLTALKDDYAVQRQSTIEHGQQAETMVATTRAEIMRSIPDFETKAPKLTQLAIDMGLSLQEIKAITDPLVVGPMALKLTKGLNVLYDKLNAPKSAEAKVKRDAPAPLQRGAAGKTLERKTEVEDPGLMSMPQYLAWRKKHADA